MATKFYFCSNCRLEIATFDFSWRKDNKYLFCFFTSSLNCVRIGQNKTKESFFCE